MVKVLLNAKAKKESLDKVGWWGGRYVCMHCCAYLQSRKLTAAAALRSLCLTLTLTCAPSVRV